MGGPLDRFGSEQWQKKDAKQFSGSFKTGDLSAASSSRRCCEEKTFISDKVREKLLFEMCVQLVVCFLLSSWSSGNHGQIARGCIALIANTGL
jgi:hypothetical protein